MEYTFKTLNDFEKVTDEVLARYNELIFQLKNKECVISKAQLEEVRSRITSELLLFMYVGEEIAGMAQLTFHCVPIRYVGYINSVVVDEKYRGHGLGTHLMEELENRAKERWSNIQAFNLTSAPKKGTAGFYLRLGYRMRTKEAADETVFYVKDAE